ncbi:MAG: type II secretion system F family protein [Candidatus Undinarchaeales archaeon]|nr:type II secretion system F family protein [Candidatus Undinarchaeales archaeon]MDP7494544.1 type II secretion system F family protein [Candidatus Undinarchaeales archaeon]
MTDDMFSVKAGHDRSWNQEAQDWSQTPGQANQGWGAPAPAMQQPQSHPPGPISPPPGPTQHGPGPMPLGPGPSPMGGATAPVGGGDWYSTSVGEQTQQTTDVEEKEAEQRSRFKFMGPLLLRFGPERIKWYRQACDAVEFFMFADDWVLVASLIGIAAFAVAFPVLTSLSDAAIMMVLIPVTGGGTFVILLSYPIFKFENRKDDIETNLPDALFQMSSNPPRTHFVELLTGLTKIGYGALTDELRVTVKEIEKGSSVKEGLEKLSERNQSKILERACYLLIRAQEQGVDIVEALAALATDIKETKYLLREQAASLQLQKITLIAAGAVLIPLILGFVVGLAQAMGQFSEDKAEIITAQVQTVQPIFLGYVIIHALEACLAIGRQEGDIKKSVYYVIPVLLIAIILFQYVAPQAMMLFMG